MGRCRAEMLEKFRKERNLHRMHHNRIVQEKNKLVGDIKVRFLDAFSRSFHGSNMEMEVQKLRNHFGKYDGLLEQLKKKYEQAVKAKALMSLERDKLRAMVHLSPPTTFAHMK